MNLRITSRILGLAFPAAVALAARAAPETGLTLARELADQEMHAEAALEYRRLAIGAGTSPERGALYWMAGYEYARGDRRAQADRMLSLAEDADAALEVQVKLLRAENDRARFRAREAAFYLESVASGSPGDAARLFAARRLAAIRMELGDPAGARDALRLASSPQDGGLAAIAEYERGRDRNYLVGGLLGLVPGLGYAYSGEYANALRSLILNALCIWGITEFAEREQWAGVAVVGFAGITFYSGSIYGGVDSAHRYNRRRLERCTLAIEGRASFEPEPELLPTLSLRFSF